MTELNTDAVTHALRESSGKWMHVTLDGETYTCRTKLTVRAAVLGQSEDLAGLVKALFKDRHDDVMDEWGWADLKALCEALAGGSGNSTTSPG